MALEASALIDIHMYNEFSGESIEEGEHATEALINFASVAMESFCKRLLKARDFSYDPADDSYDPDRAIFDGVYSDIFYLPLSPINSITELWISDDIIPLAVDHNDLNGYFMYRSAGKLVYSYGFDGGYNQNVKLKWNGGFKNTSMEMFELQHLCYELITIIKGSGTSPVFASEKIGNYSYQKFNPILLNQLQGFSPMLFNRLSRYKRKVFA
jgi:hypothetical protein